MCTLFVLVTIVKIYMFYMWQALFELQNRIQVIFSR